MKARATEIVAEIRQEIGRGGWSTPSLRALRRRYSKSMFGESPATVIAVVDALMSNGNWAQRMIACELLVERDDAIAKLRESHVERWAKGLADWGTVDLYGVTVAGVAWREGRLSDKRVVAWAKSRDRWRRRLALVATVPLNSRARGGHGDRVRTLRICSSLAGDRDPMVVKALSWALRELSKCEPAAVAEFLKTNDRRLAALVRREVRRKLTTGRKSG